jgi:hypothetical protein
MRVPLYAEQGRARRPWQAGREEVPEWLLNIPRACDTTSCTPGATGGAHDHGTDFLRLDLRCICDTPRADGLLGAERTALADNGPGGRGSRRGQAVRWLAILLLSSAHIRVPSGA